MEDKLWEGEEGKGANDKAGGSGDHLVLRRCRGRLYFED